MINKYRAFLILFLDIFALLLGLLISSGTAKLISRHVFNEYYLYALSENGGLMIYAYAFMSALLIIIFYNSGHYTKRPTWWTQVRQIAIFFIFMLIVNGFLLFAIQQHFSRLWVGLSWVHSFVIIILARQLAQIIGIKLGVWNVPTVIIGNGDNAVETMFAMFSDKYPGYEVKKVIFYKKFEGFKKIDLPKEMHSVDFITGAEKCCEFITNNKNYFYILAPEAFQEIDGEKLTYLLNRYRRQHAFVPPTKGLRLYGMQPTYFFGHDIMLLKPRNSLDSIIMAGCKRLLDIVISIITFIVTLPLLIVVAGFVASDGGPIFFAQKRVGKNGKIFKCYKFRTMRVDAEKQLKKLLKENSKLRREWERGFKLKNDPRVTKIGDFLRASSLDELPQLYNIIKGEMSLIGPRPITRGEKKYFGDKLYSYMAVRPGVTGLAQVHGRKNITFKYRVYLDHWYVQHWSILYDFAIILKTLRIVIKREGAY